MSTLTIALSKGRIFDEALGLLRAAGVMPAEDPETSRKLIIGSNHPDVRFIIVRASDVPTYVQHGAADLGVSGRDVLLEHGGDGLFQPVDLGIGRCRLVVAAKRGFDYAGLVKRGARLIVNPAALKLKRDSIQPVLEAIAGAVATESVRV